MGSVDIRLARQPVYARLIAWRHPEASREYQSIASLQLGTA